MPTSLHHLLNVHVQIGNKIGNYKKKKKNYKHKNRYETEREDGKGLSMRTAAFPFITGDKTFSSPRSKS
jgi:hypothetical protein